ARDGFGDDVDRNVVERLEPEARLPHVEVLAVRLEAVRETLRLRRIAVRGHQVERVMVLLRRDRGVAERFAVVGVRKDAQWHRIGDDTPAHLLRVTLRQVLVDERTKFLDDRGMVVGQRLQVLGDGLRLALEHGHYQSPTFPLTEAISFAGSKPTPCLNTVSTLRTSAIVFDGSPSITTRSACLPTAIDPTFASRPR